MAKKTDLDINIKVNSDTKKVKELNKDIEKTNNTVKDFNTTSKESSKISEDQAKSLLKVAENVSSLAVSIGKISFENITEPIKKTTENLKGFAVGLGVTATAMTTVETIIAKNLLGDFIGLNDEMANVNSVLLESDQNFNKLNEKVRDLSLNLKLATETEIAKGLYDVGSAGFNGAGGITVLDTAIKASKAGRADLKESSAIIASTLNGMALSAENADYVANILFKTIQRGVLTFSDLGAGLGDITATLKSLEQPLEVAGAALSLETRKGTTPAKAITNLNSLLLSFSAQSEQSKEKALELGLEMDSNAVKAKGLATVLEEVVSAAKKTGDFNGTLFTLLGRQEALNAALQLSNAKEFKKEIDEMKNSSTALSDSLNQQTKSLNTQFKEVQVQLSAIKTEAGGLVGELAGKFLPIVSEAINEFNSLSESGRKNILIFGSIIASIPAVVAGFGAITLGIGLLVAQLLISRFLFQTLLSLLGPLTTGIFAIAGAMKTAAISAYSWATGTATANTALLSIRATLTATVASLGAFVAILSTAAIAVGILTVEVIKLDQAQEEQRKNEQRNYDTQAESIKKINELREKEKQGIKLTAKEQEEYAKALVSIGDSNKILRDKALERMKASKDLSQQEKDQAKASIGFTDEEMKKRDELFQTIKDHEIATKNEYIRAKEEAKKQREEDLKFLQQNLKAKIITQEEYNQNSSIIESTYKSKLKIAEKNYNDELKKLADEKIKKQEEYANKSKELQSKIDQNTLNEFDYKRKEAKRNYDQEIKEISKLEGDKASLKIKALQAYNAEIKKINEDQKKQKEDDIKKELEDQKRFNDDKKSLTLEYSDFIRKLQTDVNKIGATESEKARIDLKENLLDIYRTYEAIKEKMSALVDPKTGKKVFSYQQIAEFTKSFSESYKAFESKQTKEISKIDFGSDFKIAIESIDDKLNELADNEDLLRGDKLQKEKTFYEQQKSITQAALKFKDDLSKESIEYYTNKEKEASDKINKNIFQTQKLQIEGLKNIQNAVKDLTNEFGLFDSKLVDSISNLIDFKNSGLEASQSLIDASSELTNKGFSGLIEWSKKGGDLTGIKQFFDLAISQSEKMFDAFKDNMREVNNFNDFASMGTDITNDLANTFTGGLTGKIGSLFGQTTYKQRQEELNQVKELNVKLSNDKIKILDTTYQIELDNINKTIKNEELKNLKIKILDKGLFNSKFEYIQKIQELNYKVMDLTEAEKITADAVMQLEKIKVEITDINELEKNRLIILKDLGNNLQKIQDSYYSDIESLMSKYYEKEVRYIKDSHKLEQANILSRQKQIELNQDKIDSLNNEINAIQEKYDKLLNNKDLSRSASQKFAGALQTFRSQNGGLDVSELIRTAPSEFERIIASRKEEIENQFNMTGDVSARSKALQELAVQQNVYWKEISKNIAKGTKEYDEAIKKSNAGFNEFKDALKDSLEAQKDFELENKNINGSVVNLKVEIEKLTKENKSYQTEINAYNKTIQNGIDSLTNKFKDASGSWITNINQARSALQGLSSDSANAVNALNNIQTNYEKAKSTSNLIVKDTTKPITSSNINTSINSSQLSSGFSDMKAGESINDYIARITREDAAAEKARLSSLNVSTTPLIKATADFSNANQKASDYNNFASGSMTVTPGIFDKSGSFGWINPLNWFANGGVSDGPTTGYPAMLHGKELILNEPQADNLMSIYRLANTRPNYSNYANSSSYNQTVIVNGSNLSEKQLTTAIKNVFSSMKQKERTAY